VRKGEKDRMKSDKQLELKRRMFMENSETASEEIPVRTTQVVQTSSCFTNQRIHISPEQMDSASRLKQLYKTKYLLAKKYGDTVKTIGPIAMMEKE
jgi:hypothetical protein